MYRWICIAAGVFIANHSFRRQLAPNGYLNARLIKHCLLHVHSVFISNLVESHCHPFSESVLPEKTMLDYDTHPSRNL